MANMFRVGCGGPPGRPGSEARSGNLAGAQGGGKPRYRSPLRQRADHGARRWSARHQRNGAP